jgi:hypothetical protein
MSRAALSKQIGNKAPKHPGINTGAPYQQAIAHPASYQTYMGMPGVPAYPPGMMYPQDGYNMMAQHQGYIADPNMMGGMYMAPPQPFIPLPIEPEEEDPETKKNKLPIYGNETTCNINSMLHNNILESDYFKALYQLRTYHATIGKCIVNY